MARTVLSRRKVPDDAATLDPSQGRAIVASARRIDLSDAKATKKAMGKRQSWQADAWVMFDAIGEVKYADNFLANAVGRLRLYPAVQMEPDGPPVPIEDSDLPDTVKAAARDALSRIRLDIGGQGALLRALALNLEVAGECWLIGYPDVPAAAAPAGQQIVEPREERWEVRSVSEVFLTADGKVSVKQDPVSQPEELDPDTLLFRIWEPHPQWINLPDSPLHGVLSECDELLILSRMIRAQARSRLGAGIMLVPTEVSFGGPDQTTGEDESDPFAVKLMDSMMAPIGDEGDPSAVVPLVIRAKGEHLHPDMFRHITLDRPVDATAAAQRQELLQRIAQGLNLPPEVILGMAQSNHWTAWQVDASTFSSHIEPRAIGIVQSLGAVVFRPLLEAYEGVTPELAARVMVWYDESEVVTQPDRAQDAKDAHDRHAISDDALRKATGFGDTDKPSDEELARRLAVARGLVDAPTTQALLAMYAMLGKPFLDQVDARMDAIPATSSVGGAPKPAGAPDTAPKPPNPDAGPPPGNGSDQAAALLAAAGTNPGRRLAAIDRDLFVRLRVAADAALARTLEKAGARLRTKAGKVLAARQAVNGVDNHLVASTLGAAMVAAVGATDDELLADQFDQLHRQWDAWVTAAQAAALATAVSSWAINDTQREAAERAQAEHRDEAWAWLAGALLALARQRLYDPHPDAPEVGEHDPTMAIPAAMIREAMARAGGATQAGMTVRATDMGGIELLTNGGAEPAGGIGTGATISQLATDVGVRVDSWLWEHGDPNSPFEPHASLNGQIGDTEDDPVFGGWFPGDHQGCTCQLVPLYGVLVEEPDELVAE